VILTEWNREWPKWSQTIKTSWTKYTTYRINFFLQIIGPALVFFFIKYNLWTSIYNGDTNLVIQGYDLHAMINYHVWSLIVGLVAQGHNALNLSEEIRLGKISTYLIYPFDFWKFHTAGFFSFQFLQIFVALITITVLSMIGLLKFPTLSVLAIGLTYTLYVSAFWFALQFLTGILAFWLEETWILRVILQIVAAFLSGAIIPLDLYPEFFVTILDYTPFPYITYYAIRIFTGETHLLLKAVPVISFWLVVTCFLNHLIWKRGIRLYTAAGM
jgi:ABC-2 type transport system permease protein